MATQESLARVQELYVAYYGRPADQAGLDYWADRVDDEGEAAIINAFGNSAEYAALAEGQGNATLIDNIYQQAFGRPADVEGLAYYAGVLEAGDKTLAEIATTITNAAGGIDKQTLNARVEAASEYTAEFGAEADYDINAAKDAVDSAEPGVYTPELTPAIEALQAAQQAESDYLQDEVASNDAVAEQLADNDNPTDTEIEDALGTVVTAKQNAVNTAGGITLDANASVAAAQINAQRETFEDNVSDEKATVAKTDGLASAISSLKAAEGRYEDALKAEIKTDKALDGEVAKFNALNDGQTDLTANDDGTIDDLIVDENGTLVAADDVDPASLEGFDALLASAQAQFDATQSVTKFETAFEKALTSVVNTEAGNKDFTASESDYTVDAEGNVTLDTLATNASESSALLSAQTDLEAFNKAVGEYEEVVALQNKADDLDQAVTDATDAFGDLDVNLGSISDGDDLFIFDADSDATINAGFGTDGDDLLYIGDSFTQGDLDLATGEALKDTDQGNADTLEVFFQQGDNGAVLSFENKAFAGNSEAGFDGVTVTLTGVNADDLQLDNGYISIA